MYPKLFDACNNCGASKNAGNSTCQNNQTVEWIYNVFHECVNTPKEEVGFFLGLISIGCWITATIPQLVENYKKKRVEEAISIWLLLFWLFGDSSSLTGCLLTGQLPIQIVTAVYYVFMDIVLIVQYLYYKIRNRRRAKSERNGVVNGNLANGNTQTNIIVACVCFMAIVPLSLFRTKSEYQSFSSFEHNRIGRTLLDSGDIAAGPLIPTDPEDIIGYVLGCISSTFYLSARLPQIIKNYRRGDTDGVSMYLFILAISGNSLYGSSILLQDPAPGKTYTQFIMLHLPWLVGSLGTLSLDFTVLAQILYYNPSCKKKPSSVDDDEDPLLACEHDIGIVNK